MATGNTTRFEELTKLAIDFVTTKKGLWDHAIWMDFISNLQAKGFDISGDMQTNLGSLLEAMKQFYAAAASTESVEKAMKVVVSDSVTFVRQHQGVWGHSEWEDFVKTVERNTFSLSEGTTAYLGGILESIKILYALSPLEVAQKHLSSVRAETEVPPAASRSAAAIEEKPETKPAAAEVPEKEKETKAAKAASKPLPPTPKQQTETPPAASQPAATTKEKPETKPAAAEISEKAKETKKAAKAASRPSPTAPKQQDDLTAIGGIGPALAKKLNEGGIFSYAQIAALSDDEIEHLEKNVIRFPGRIKRDDWISQAQALPQDR